MIDSSKLRSVPALSIGSLLWLVTALLYVVPSADADLVGLTTAVLLTSIGMGLAVPLLPFLAV